LSRASGEITITLENRADARGCRVELMLPLRAQSGGDDRH
jgi:hypothetical protein